MGKLAEQTKWRILAALAALLIALFTWGGWHDSSGFHTVPGCQPGSAYTGYC